MRQEFQPSTRWQSAKALRSRSLSGDELLQLAEDPILGERAWILHRPCNQSATEVLPALLSVNPHHAVLPSSAHFSGQDGFSSVFPAIEAATLEEVFATLDQNGDRHNGASVASAGLGERIFCAIRANLFDPNARGDSHTWKQEDARLAADLCLQVVRIAMYLESQGAAVSLRASRLLLTPFGRVLLWAVPENAATARLSLHGAGEIVAQLLLLTSVPENSPLSAIAYAAHPAYAQDRYDSLASLAADLQRYLDGAPVHARRPGTLLCFARQSMRRPERAAAVFLLAAAATVATIWALSPASPAPATQPPALEKVEEIPALPVPKPEAPKAQTARRAAMASVWSNSGSASSSVSPR